MLFELEITVYLLVWSPTTFIRLNYTIQLFLLLPPLTKKKSELDIFDKVTLPYKMLLAQPKIYLLEYIEQNHNLLMLVSFI